MMHKLRIIALLILCCSTANINAQSKAVLEDQAYDYLNVHDYVNAYDAFDKLNARYPKEMLYEFNLGVCCLYFPEKKERAIEIFKSVKTKYKTVGADVYLGKAYHMNYRFDEALAILNPLLPQLEVSKKKEDKEMIPEVKLTILNCENGNVLIKNKVIADIENIGSPVNTPELEGAPIITADESLLIYTYVGKKSMGGKMNAQMKNDANGMYLSDIYMSRKDSSGTKWLPGEPVITLNTKGNDAALAMSPDGTMLFSFYSTNENEGDIRVSTLTGKDFSPPVALNTNINTPEYWEGSCSITADGKFLYFASERPTGLGGRDLYVSELTNGSWGPAVNLGPKINTIYDDDAPFIHPDGVTLFFSSKGHTSIGGYDIMFAIKEGSEWGEPKSMGIPLNTVEDDSYYVINSKGDKGFFSSGRSAKGSLGELDIYMVTPGILGQKPIVALMKGTVLAVDKPVEAKIEVTKIAKSESMVPFFSNKETGKYLVALSPGYIYKFKVSAEGFKSIEEDFDFESLTAYVEKNKDFVLYPLGTEAPVVTQTQVPVAALTETTAPVVPTETPASTETPTIAAVVVKDPIKEVDTTEPVLGEAIAKKAEKEVKKLTAKKPKAEKPKKEPVVETVAVETPCDNVLPDLNPLKGTSLNDTEKYNMLVKLLGNYCADRVLYTVQIGAYKVPENYNYDNLKKLGEITSAKYPDGITRFTQKEFKTLREADQQRLKLIAKGQKDAWVVVFVDGKRYTLEDFIMADFLGKPVN